MEKVTAWFGTAVLFSLTCLSGLAQTPGQVLSTFGPEATSFGSYSIGDLETIDNVYGSVQYRIPLASLPPGRAGMSLGLPLVYNSNFYNVSLGPEGNGSYTTDLVTGTIWQYAYEYSLELDENLSFDDGAVSQTCSAPPAAYNAYDYKFYQFWAILPDGSRHLLHLYGASDDYSTGFYQEIPGTVPPCPSGQSGDFVYHTDDGTFLKVVISQGASYGGPADTSCGRGTQYGPLSWPSQCWKSHPWIMYLANGQQVFGEGTQESSIKDANGNAVTVQNVDYGNGSPTAVLQDDFGRQITLAHTVAGTNSATDVITQTVKGNNQLHWTVTWGPQNVNGNGVTYPNCSNPDPTSHLCYLPNFTAVTSISFPQADDLSTPTYTFGYDVSGWGQLNMVTLPSGALVKYCYQFGSGCSSPYAGTTIPLYPPRDPVLQKTVSFCDESDQPAPVVPPAACPVAATSYTWSFQFPFVQNTGKATGSSVIGPDGSTTTYSFTDIAPENGYTSPNAGLVNSISNSDGSSVSRTWSHNAPYETTNGTAQSPSNPYISAETRTAAGGGPTATKSYTYDNNGNLLSETDSDWSSSGGSGLRTVSQTFTATTPAATATGTADNANAYWNSSSPALRSLVGCRSFRGSGNGAVTQYSYDGNGNLTQVYDWNSRLLALQPLNCSPQLTSSNAVGVTRGYDGHGNLTGILDGNGNLTSIAYDSQSLYITSVTDAAGSGLQRSTSYSSDTTTGWLNVQIDYNGLTRNWSRDNFGRPTELVESQSSGTLRETATKYEGANRRIITTTDNAAPGDQQLVSVVEYDQLGRVRLTRQMESPADSPESDTTGIKVQTRYGYSAQLSYQLVSNPYRAGKSSDAGSEATMGWTLTASNWSPALSSVTVSTGAAAPAPSSAPTTCPASGTATGSQVTCLAGNVATVTDEAGVQRTNTADGLGRLTQVVENGIGATTTYGFDVMGNLTGVAPQGGTGTRSFVYDSLSRLQSATNPESGTTTYTYDNDSNLITRTDGRTVAATSTYDALNRITGKSYSDYGNANPTPWVAYRYQGTTDFLSSVSSNVSYTYSNYDALGRPATGTQVTGGQTYAFPTVLWTPQGQVKSARYPSGRTVTTSFDTAGRIAGVSGILSGTTTPYFGSATYAAQGAPSGVTTGDGLSRTWTYNGRLQPTQITAGSQITLGLGWKSNGTLSSQSISRPGFNASQSYTYDGVNRLKTAAEGSTWNQTYVYDVRGNRAITGNSSMLVSNYTPQSPDGTTVPFNGANQWQLAAGYDGAGNMITVRTQTMGYDAESRMTAWADSSTGASVAFAYDGDGRRVTKTSGGQATTYVYDPAGNLAAEYGGAASGTTGTLYLTQDHLGSTRLVTNGSGCVGAHDYLPFGEEIPGSFGRSGVACYGQTDTLVKFTGQERDAETGLDYFGARYNSSAQGRFTSPDPSRLSAFFDNPQSWNMYTYAYNNPLRFVDKNGMWPTAIHNQIIETAFPNLTPDQRQILKDVSYQQDFGSPAQQGNALAFQHAMGSPGQTPDQAEALYNQFVQQNEDQATQAQVKFWLAGNPGLSKSALAKFATALHAILDSTSPAHAGFQTWDWRHPILARTHALTEISITPGQLSNAALTAQGAFVSTFGFNPFDWLQLQTQQPTPQPAPPGKVTTSICYTLDDGTQSCQ